MRAPSWIAVTAIAAMSWAGAAGALDVAITPTIDTVETLHQGETVTIQRNQNTQHRVDPYFTYTSRECPPFCIQPAQVAPGVETVAELEVLDALRRIGEGAEDVLVVDSRTAQWPRRAMIPGAVNVPWTSLDPEQAEPEAVGAILRDTFGAVHRDGAWDFGPAKTLVLYCNGMWCAQSNSMVVSLLRYGYPAAKLKWYRGGMQNWSNVGLTTVRLR